MRVYPFTYTGNATDNTDITGCPFTPTLAWIKPADATANGGALSWVGLGSDLSFDPSNSPNPSANMIQAWNSDGIEIGSAANVNSSGVDYYGVMMTGDSTEYAEGSYTGDGGTSNYITVGFQPDIIFFKRTSGSASIGRFNTEIVNVAQSWSAANGSDMLDTDATGYTITSASSQINGAGAGYKWVAFKNTSGFMATGTYTGNATDNRAITGVGFQPDVVVIKANSGAKVPVFRTSVHSGDDSSLWATTLANTTDRIQSLDSDGFTVGANDDVNMSGRVITWWAFRDNPPASAGGDFFLTF